MQLAYNFAHYKKVGFSQIICNRLENYVNESKVVQVATTRLWTTDAPPALAWDNVDCIHNVRYIFFPRSVF